MSFVITNNTVVDATISKYIINCHDEFHYYSSITEYEDRIFYTFKSSSGSKFIFDVSKLDNKIGCMTLYDEFNKYDLDRMQFCATHFMDFRL